MKPAPFALAAIAAAACSTAAPRGQVASAGERAYQKCYSCHSLEPEEDLSGPTLNRIVGRRIAMRPGFDYSPALRQFAKANPVWTEELLDLYSADPEALVPGTSMAFHGIRDPDERAALIRYLQSYAGSANRGER